MLLVRISFGMSFLQDDHQLSFQWSDGDFVITDNMALSHRAGDDATQPAHIIGLRILHRSSAYAKRAASPARGYVKRADRRKQYLRHKEELEMQNNFESVNIKTWCPESDEELCDENGELIPLFRSEAAEEREITSYDTRGAEIKDVTIGSVEHTKIIANKDEL